MGIRSGREGVRRDQVDCYGRIKGLDGKTLQETLESIEIFPFGLITLTNNSYSKNVTLNTSFNGTYKYNSFSLTSFGLNDKITPGESITKEYPYKYNSTIEKYIVGQWSVSTHPSVTLTGAVNCEIVTISGSTKGLAVTDATKNCSGTLVYVDDTEPQEESPSN